MHEQFCVSWGSLDGVGEHLHFTAREW
jgi:hypothetical protein